MSNPQQIVDLCLFISVDDEPQIRRFLRAGLELEGIGVREASTGKEAIRAATLRSVDLVILDPGLPDMDGSEIVETASVLVEHSHHRSLGQVA